MFCGYSVVLGGFTARHPSRPRESKRRHEGVDRQRYRPLPGVRRGLQLDGVLVQGRRRGSRACRFPVPLGGALPGPRIQVLRQGKPAIALDRGRGNQDNSRQRIVGFISIVCCWGLAWPASPCSALGVRCNGRPSGRSPCRISCLATNQCLPKNILRSQIR